MVGGGEGSFIGPVHRLAAELDGAIELVAGVFSSDAQRSRRSGVNDYGLDESRCYGTVAEMLAAEARLPEEQRMEFVCIVTPNHLHVAIASQIAAAGFAVVCDKPVSHSLTVAQEFASQLSLQPVPFMLTHNYTGYPMIREARLLIEQGALGKIRRIDCEYLQGWLADAQETQDNKQAAWRTDPEQAGRAGCFGDIGSHCQNLLEFVSGLEIAAVAADLTSFIPGRRVDDDGNVLLRFDSGARGTIAASQIAVGEENGLCLRIYGERGGLRWAQQAPNSLVVHLADQPMQVRRSAGPGIAPASLSASRLPAGHVEGYLEAFANLYREFAEQMQRRRQGSDLSESLLPGIAEALRGMQFIDAVVESSQADGAWRSLSAE